MIWLWCLPTLVTFPWVLYAVGRFATRPLGNVDREGVRKIRDNGYRAMGFFEISIGLTLIGFSVQQGGSWATAPSVILLGIGFVIASWWHPLDRLDGSDA